VPNLSDCLCQFLGMCLDWLSFGTLATVVGEPVCLALLP